MRERTLYLQVLDYDRFSRNDPIGEVSIPLNKVELGQIKTFWKELKPCSDGSVRERRDGQNPVFSVKRYRFISAMLFVQCSQHVSHGTLPCRPGHWTVRVRHMGLEQRCKITQGARE